VEHAIARPTTLALDPSIGGRNPPSISRALFGDQKEHPRELLTLTVRNRMVVSVRKRMEIEASLDHKTM